MPIMEVGMVTPDCVRSWESVWYGVTNWPELEREEDGVKIMLVRYINSAHKKLADITIIPRRGEPCLLQNVTISTAYTARNAEIFFYWMSSLDEFIG